MNQNFDGQDWREKYRVRIGFIFAVIFIWRAQPRFIPFLVIGFIISLIGVLIRQWSAGCVKKNDELARRGPYALVRHPLYLGSFLAAFGLILSATSFSFSLKHPYLDRTLFFWAFFWILVDSIYLPKIRKEENLLEKKFDQEFLDYKKTVPQLFPKKLGKADFHFDTFDLGLWKKNGEIASVIGFIVIYGVLIGRYLYR